MLQSAKADKVIDARKSFCPGPLMELIRAVREARVGQVVEVWSRESGSITDIPAWVKKAGQNFVGMFDEGDYRRFVVEKVK